MGESPISASKADTIRDRFTRLAAENRAQADAAEASGDSAKAESLRTLADSQDRMAVKRYEAMRVVSGF